MKSAKGWSVFWRPAKSRWVLSRVVDGAWTQKILADAPHENTKAAERAAIAIAHTWMAQQGERPGEALEAKPRGMTLEDASSRWLALAERKVKDGLIAPATLKDYRIDVKLYILPPIVDPAEGLAWTGGSLSLADLDVPRARRWLRAIRGAKSASTVRGARSSFGTLYACAVAEGWIRGDNPFSNAALLDELPDLPVASNPIVLSLAWVQQLLDDLATPLAWRARYALAATSGARDGEIHGARICDVVLDGETPTWRIEQATAIVGREGFATTGDTKTRSSVRTLPVHPASVAAIREWLGSGWARWVGRSPALTDPLFPGEDGLPSRPRSAENLRGDLARLGLPTVIDGKPIDFKALRATFATALHEAGVDEHARKRLMGHASRSVTERHYTRRELSALSAAVQTIPLAWRGDRTQVVTSATMPHETASKQAAPARVELAANGLGNPCDVACDCDHEAEFADGCGGQSVPLIGTGDHCRRPIVAAGHSGALGLVTDAGRLALEVEWWAAADRMSLEGMGQ